MSIIRKLRGIINNAVVWATTWAGLGAALLGLGRLIGGEGLPMDAWVAGILLPMSAGFLGGATFSLGLLLTERKRTQENLRVGGTTAWGAFAGLAGPLLVMFLGSDLTWVHLSLAWPVLLGTTVFGAGSGAAMARIARGGLGGDRLAAAVAEDTPVIDGQDLPASSLSGG